jgi:hypothetical protein
MKYRKDLQTKIEITWIINTLIIKKNSPPPREIQTITTINLFRASERKTRIHEILIKMFNSIIYIL